MILASSSPYKKRLLEDLGLSFQSISPSLDESIIQKNPNLSPKEKAEKLSYEKGYEISLKYPNKVIISGDQLAVFENKILTKTNLREKNIEQLFSMSGKAHQLFTSNTIFIPKKGIFTHTEIAHLDFKKLSLAEITNYVDTDKAWDCAGGYKYELNGKDLFEKVTVDDIYSIQGMCIDFIKKHLL